MNEAFKAVSVRQRQAGCLLGLAWGDASGCPVEFWNTDDVVRVFGQYTGLPEIYPFDKLPADEVLWAHLRPLGLHSDDTQQALALIRTCLAPGGWQMQAWADLLVRGEKKRAWRGTGRFFRAAVQALAQGVSPLASGSRSAGVGAAMRIAPLGALYAGQPEGLANVVLESSRVTHAEPCAIAGSFAIACACAALVRGIEVADLRRGLVAEVRRFERQILAPAWGEEGTVGTFSDALQVALDPSHKDLAASRAALCDHGRTLMTAEGQHSPVTPNHPFAPIGCTHALSAALWPAGDPQVLLGEVIRQGGDTDTIGAMAGAILGALQVALDPSHKDLAASRAALCDHGRTLMTAEVQHSPVTPNHPFAPIGCTHALSAALWPAGDPQALLGEVIRQGGDTDTIGAMAGAILGARFGWDWIPVERLRDEKMLLAYAKALSDGGLPESEDAFLQREASYSAEERQFSRACMARFPG